jgi:hypothetical protein
VSNHKLILIVTSLITSILLAISSANAAITMKPTPLQGLEYKGSILSGDYRSDITSPETLLGFPVGQMAATPEQIMAAIAQWDSESNLMQVSEYARSHEGRPLVYAIISSEQNLARLDQIKSDIGSLADPRNTSEAEANKIIARLPGVAWMAYSIHGNESSGADSALAAIYHLIASEDPMIKALLDDLVIIIDPLMNPDGRARFTKELQESRQITPNVDDQSLLHTGSWPYGRTNHYLFDLNRDFIFGVHPETQGRVKALNEWYPQLMIDGHEMGPQATYLFGPPREPINKNIAKSVKRWSVVFSEDQGEAFDDENWPYYTGEWFENLFAGYSNYVEYRGSIHILYEQARMAEDGVMQGNDRILSYAESVDHQFVSTIANLKTLAKHSKDIYKDFVEDRRLVSGSKSPYADKTYAFVPTGNDKRMREFLHLLKVQNFELKQLSKETKLTNVTNAMGEKETVTLPAGTILLNNRQPEARLIAAMLELDPLILDKVLVEERQRTLRNGSSVMYDTTAWNLAMMHGIEFYRINDEISKNVVDYTPATPAQSDADLSAAIAYMVDGADDASVAFAARLMEQGVQVRISDKPSEFGGAAFNRGSVLVNRYDNEFFKGDLLNLVTETANELSLAVRGISTGYGKGDLPELGGSHFDLLERPLIGLLTRAGVNFYDYGSIWHSIDSNLGIRHSHLDLGRISYMDLRRYNVLVLPDRFFGNLSKAVMGMLDTWVKEGGTLIVSKRSVRQMTHKENGISGVRQLQDVLDKTKDYDLAQMQEWLSQQDDFAEIDKARSRAVSITSTYPLPKEAIKLTEEQEGWQRQFMPAGAIVAARTDQKHWLTYGLRDIEPVMVTNIPVLMSGKESEAPVRLGQWVPSSDKEKTMKKYNWFHGPEGYDMNLRMSGLLWPEAAQRLANAAYLTRERKGRGQIILFAEQPIFRGATKVTNRMLLNALVYGPGLGASSVINL